MSLFPSLIYFSIQTAKLHEKPEISKCVMKIVFFTEETVTPNSQTQTA
jgi:hypothetical protein